MKAPLARLVRTRVFRYLVTGGIGFAAELGTIWIVRDGFHGTAVAAVATSFWIGLAVSFFLQKFFTFANVERTAKAVTRQTFFFAVLVAINYLFTIAFVALTENLIASTGTARAIALVITTAWNFLAYKYVIFRTPPRR